MSDHAYAARFFDGEGCIQLKKQKQRRGFAPLLLAVQVTPAPLEKLQSLYGGNISCQRKRAPWRPLYKWELTGKDNVKAALDAMYPWLIVKREAADVLYEYLSSMREVRGHPRLSEEEVAQRTVLADRLRALNTPATEIGV